MRRAAIVALILLFLIGGRTAATPLTILYTNDLHLRFERLDSLERLIAGQREEIGPLLLLDAGDTWQDFRRPIAAVWGSDEMAAWMNRAGYDAMTLGNHDFYWGAERLIDLSETAVFPLLSANLLSANQRPINGRLVPFAASATLEVRDLVVHVIGLTTPEYHPFSAYPWLRYAAPIEALRSELARVPPEADLNVVLAHLPIADAAVLAVAVPGIDVFITGHSHEETLEPLLVGETVIVQSGRFAANLGRLDLEIGTDGRYRVVAHRLIPTEEAPVDSSQGLRQLARVLAALSVIVLLVLS